MKPETARKAAKWWGDYLRSPAIPDNGDNSLNGAMATVIAMMLQTAENKNGSPDDADKFEASLAEIILESGDHQYIGVDYHPDGTLQRAADKAGVNLGATRLPWKTSMWIEGDKIQVAAGYRASVVDL